MAEKTGGNDRLTMVVLASKACLDLLNEHMAVLPDSVITWLRPDWWRCAVEQ